MAASTALVASLGAASFEEAFEATLASPARIRVRRLHAESENPALGLAGHLDQAFRQLQELTAEIPQIGRTVEAEGGF